MEILLTQKPTGRCSGRFTPSARPSFRHWWPCRAYCSAERTALKVMLQLLVDRRDTLRWAISFRCGDLWDVVAHGDEAFTRRWRSTSTTPSGSIPESSCPMLEKQHDRPGVDLEKAKTDDDGRNDAAVRERRPAGRRRCSLSALVPEVESLGRSAPAARRAQSRDDPDTDSGQGGTGSPRRCQGAGPQAWARFALAKRSNPTISVQLSGVDTERSSAAKREDSRGTAIQPGRVQMLFEQIGVQREGEFEQSYELLWKNTRRSCIMLFKNIRELSDSSLENDGGEWKLVIDFPFDEAGHGPKDDLSKLQAFKTAHPNGTRTICWLPAFFSHDAQKDLGSARHPRTHL